MNPLQTVALLVSAALLIYLVITLLFPEKF